VLKLAFLEIKTGQCPYFISLSIHYLLISSHVAKTVSTFSMLYSTQSYWAVKEN